MVGHGQGLVLVGVTMTVVTPSRRCRARSSTCMLSRRPLSRAPSGSSSSRTAGSITSAAGERHALLLAAGKLREAPAEIGQAHEIEGVADALDGVGPADAAHVQPEGDVLAHRHVRNSA